jgi:hypothetical protein
VQARRLEEFRQQLQESGAVRALRQPSIEAVGSTLPCSFASIPESVACVADSRADV